MKTLILILILILSVNCQSSELLNQQIVFTKKVALLIQFADSIGYDLTFGDCFAKTGHKKNSLHYKRLAVDLNLFINGKYMEKTKDHLPLGLFWESIGGTWGGRFYDGNHFEWKE